MTLTAAQAGTSFNSNLLNIYFRKIRLFFLKRQNTKANEVACFKEESSQNAVRSAPPRPKAIHLLMREDNTSVCLH